MPDPDVPHARIKVGAVVALTVKCRSEDATPVFPAASVAFAEMAYAPLDNDDDTTDQAPPLLAAVVPIRVPGFVLLLYTLTVANASEVPDMVGVGVVTVELSAGVVIIGAAGATVSTVTVIEPEFGDVLPAASVALARIV